MNQQGSIGEFVRTIIWALVLAGIFRSFLFEPFNIPSGSMKPTLLIGDYIFVSKYSYGYSNYSFPFSPDLFTGRIWATKPERGDVAVFRPENMDNVDFIKRIVGMPGDMIQVRGGVLYINGKMVNRKRIDNFYDEDFGYEVKSYLENLNGKQYKTLDIEYTIVDNTKIYIVPEGHYFMMGDNRDNSDDSRSGVGFVPYKNLVGKAEFVFFSIGGGSSFWELWNWPFEIRVDRFFNIIN